MCPDLTKYFCHLNVTKYFCSLHVLCSTCTEVFCVEPLLVQGNKEKTLVVAFSFSGHVGM